jgi:hypothetical protein
MGSHASVFSLDSDSQRTPAASRGPRRAGQWRRVLFSVGVIVAAMTMNGGGFNRAAISPRTRGTPGATRAAGIRCSAASPRIGGDSTRCGSSLQDGVPLDVPDAVRASHFDPHVVPGGRRRVFEIVGLILS